MSDTQQDVIIYKAKGMKNAQRRFEEDLRKRQQEGWKVVSITPMGVQITVVYERDAAAGERIAADKAAALAEKERSEREKKEKKKSAWKRFNEYNEQAAAKERAYQLTLTPEQLRKRKRRNFIISSTTFAVVLVLCISCSMFSYQSSKSDTADTVITPVATSASTPKPTATPKPKPTPKPTPTPKPKPTPVPFAHFGDGTFVVGKDIQPGTYRTRDASFDCYYARLKGFSGTVSDIIANNNTVEPAIVTISSSDKGFQSSNCGTWTKDLSAITVSPTTFTDGMYIVGTDIRPGTYKSSGQTGCYYARLNGFGNTVSDILANDNTDSPAVVTISADDKGFQSSNCGTWTKE